MNEEWGSILRSILSHFRSSPHPVKPPPVDEDIIPLGNGNEKAVLTTIGNRKYRIVSDDIYLQHIRGEFEPDTVKLLQSLTGSGDCVFDVGANIGCTSLLLSEQARHIYSFEPSPTTFRFLEMNMAEAGVKNVTPVNLGLGNMEGEFSLSMSPQNRSGGFVSNQFQGADGLAVEKIRIVRGDEFLDSAGIAAVDFIKIDVEGFEKDVLQGLSETLRRCKPVVTLELNHWCLNVFQRMSVPDFLDFLRSMFPYLYAIEKDDVKNLHDPTEAYHVMYHHVVNQFKYPAIVGAYDKERLQRFADTYRVTL